MIIALRAFNTRAQIQHFHYQLGSLEAGLDLISRIVSQGSTLLEAKLIDQGRITPLPPKAFDGQPLLEPIRQLEVQWRGLLNKPVN